MELNRRPQKFYLPIFIILLFSVSFAKEKGVSVSLVLSAYPSAFRPVRCVEIRNTLSKTIKGRLHFRVSSREYGTLLEFKTRVLRVKPGDRRVWLYDISPREVVYHKSKFKGHVKKTRLLPAGYTSVCCEFIDLSGQRYGRSCVDFHNLSPESPKIIYPPDGFIISENKPTFLWTPVLVRPGVPAYYNIKIWKKEPGESEKDIIRKTPLWERKNIYSVWVNYSSDGPTLKPDHRYHIKIEALSKGYLIAESRITTFIFRPSWQISDSTSYRFDAGIEGVIEPGDSILPIKTSLIPCAIFKNFGEENIAFKALCEISRKGEVIYQNTEWIGNLESGASRDISFLKWTPPDTGEYLIKFVSNLSSDRHNKNDSLVTFLRVIR